MAPQQHLAWIRDVEEVLHGAHGELTTEAAWLSLIETAFAGRQAAEDPRQP